ncbi:hypothetical protein RJT34_04239 [Clitoria ternatea]|uniref:non-specific serine/threonine protein kinase n=1 Tax=Clitoria ternatea TaxID=43366 RepID=A0AAN9Q5X7_CLITE
MTGCEWHFGPLPCHVKRTILFLLIIIITPLANTKPQSFEYPDFNSIQLKKDGRASTSSASSAIQLTGTNGPNPTSNGTAGRVTYPEPINLRDNTLNELYDFTTKFSFVISSKNQSAYGVGLAFFLATPTLPSINDTPQLRGGGLGVGLVFGNQHLIEKRYTFVAVEFDTFSNAWDPDGSHVGININSMQSDIFEEWQINITKGKVCDCGIQYNSRNSMLDVFFTGYRFSGEDVTQQLSYRVNISDVLLSDSVIVGISAATGANFEEHTLLSWSFVTSLPNNENSQKRKFIHLKFLVGMGIGIGLYLSFFGLLYTLIMISRIKKGKEENVTSEDNSYMDDKFPMSTGPKKIHYNELVTATNNFEETQKLGHGGFGVVYKGYFQDSKSHVAVKRISTNSRQGVKQYAAEVKIISQLRHRNLVKLTGWCHKRNDLLLIYEYMPNGSLDSHLFRGESILSWNVRYNIALGIASALFYLQQEWEKCVLHKDIKSSNIMLDSNFNAKLGDFGLARLVDHEKGSETTDVAGTMGYIAPEYVSTGKARKESDIFSFGVVLLEVATGRKTIHHKEMESEEVSLVEWVWELYGLGSLLVAVDPTLCGEFDVKQMECLLVVGLWCANPDCTSRPSIREVVKVLNFEAPLPILPQHIPVLAYVCRRTDELFFTVPTSFMATT